jgi:hypothetical protein
VCDSPFRTLDLIDSFVPTVCGHMRHERGGVGVRVRLLGPVDLLVDGVPRAIQGLRRKAVLAALALRPGEVVSTDRLIDVVWGDAAPATAANTLQSHVSYLRRTLGARSATSSTSVPAPPTSRPRRP